MSLNASAQVRGHVQLLWPSFGSHRSSNVWPSTVFRSAGGSRLTFFCPDTLFPSRSTTHVRGFFILAIISLQNWFTTLNLKPLKTLYWTSDGRSIVQSGIAAFVATAGATSAGVHLL